jgi:uncharacterized protein YjdB
MNHSEATESRDDETWLQVLFSLEPVDLNALRSGSKKIKDFKWVLGGGAYVTSGSSAHDLYFPTGQSDAESPSSVRSYMGDLTPKELMEQYLTPKSYVNSLAGRLAKALCQILNDPEAAILNGTDAWGSVNQRYYQDEEITIYGYTYIGGYSFYISTFMYYPKVTRQAFRSQGISYDNIPLADYFFNNYPVDVRMIPQLPGADALPYRLSMGQTLQLSYTASCRGSSYLHRLSNVRWESSRPEIVSVDANGLLTAHSPGEAVITLLMDDDNLSQGTNGVHRLTGHVVVPLPKDDSYIESQIFINSIIYLKQGNSTALSAALSALTWNGQPVSFSSLLWSTSDYDIVSCRSDAPYRNATLTAKATGSATVTLKIYPAFSSSLFNTLHPTITVTDDVMAHYGFSSFVLTREAVVLPPSQSIQFSPPLPKGEIGYTLHAGDSLLFTFSISNAQPNSTPIWISSLPNVVSVSNNGLVKALSPGATTLTVSGYNTAGVPVGANCKIIVPLPDYHKLPDRILNQGQASQVTIPSLTWNGTVLPLIHSAWTSSNPTIATVTPDGQVMAVNSGEVTLFFTFAAPHTFDPITVAQRIIVPPFLRINPSLPVGKNTTTLPVGKSLQCHVEALYNFAVYPSSNYSWTSSHPAVATVTPPGHIEALSPGETLLSVTIPEHTFGDSPLLATRLLTVVPNPIVRILTPLTDEEEEDITLSLHQSLQLTVKTSWNNADYSLSDSKWESSHPDIVAIDPNGLITALNPGTATLTFTATGSVNPITVTRRVLVSSH